MMEIIGMRESLQLLSLLLIALLLTSCESLTSHVPASLATDVPSASPSPVQAITATPPWPVATLPPVVDDWTLHDLPEVGVRLSLPTSWAVIRMPGFYMAGPEAEMSISTAAGGVTIGFVDHVPLNLPDLTAEMAQRLQDQHAAEIHPAQIEIGAHEGLAFWELPSVCLTVYVPAHGLVHEITLMPPFCDSGEHQLHPIGEHILESIEFFPVP
jgi:hypothetical protein